MPNRFFWIALTFWLVATTASAAPQQPACAQPSNTYELIQTAIWERHGCSVDYCHGANRDAGLDLRADVSYQSLIGGEPADDEDAGDQYDFVVPGHPERSLVWLTIAKKTLNLDVAVAPMPIARLALSADEVEGVRRWILAGAREKGTVNGVDNLIPPVCPQQIQPGEEAIPPPCAPGESDLLLPDLVTDPPDNVRVLYRGNHRVLSFTTGIANLGDGPLVVQAAERPSAPGESLDAVQILTRTDGSKCSRPAGAIMYQYEGKYWSYGDLAEFELRKDDPVNGEVVARRQKSFFCLLDTDPINASQDLPHQYDAHCEDEIGRMGISVGYRDVYHRVHPGQWIDIDEDPGRVVEPGDYYLVNIVDPSDTLLEKDGQRAANSSYTRVTVRLPMLDSVGTVPTPEPTATVAVRPRPQHPSHIRPTLGLRPDRPTRPPRATPPPRPTRLPRATRPPRAARPTRAPRPPRATRAPRPTHPPRPPRPTRPPRPGQEVTPPPTTGPDGAGPGAGVPPVTTGRCEATCDYNLSQVRMTWYDQTGLDLDLQVRPLGCPVIAPAAGEPVTVRMMNWTTEAGQVSAYQHSGSLVLTGAGGASAGGRSVEMDMVGDVLRLSYKASDAAPARAADGMSFPVSFDLCITVGRQTVAGFLVCQPKSTGMLCHL